MCLGLGAIGPKPVANPAKAIIGSMTLYAANRSSFSWQIAPSSGGGFDASYRFERRVDGQPYSEKGVLHLLSRDIALVWLCVQAVVRGFDGRGVR
jgi:hypothetical protein